MTGHWGYPEQQQSMVKVMVPVELAQDVATFVQDPDAFVAAVQQPATVRLVRVGEETWIDPTRIVCAVEMSAATTRLHLDGLPDSWVDFDGTVADLQRVLSDPAATVDPPSQQENT